MPATTVPAATIERTYYELKVTELTLRALFIDPWGRHAHVEYRCILPSGDVRVRDEGRVDLNGEAWIQGEWGTIPADVDTIPAEDEGCNCWVLPAADVRQISADLGLNLVED